MSLERDLICSALYQYDRVSFLKEEDFELYGKYWKALEETKGDLLKTLEIHPELVRFENLSMYSYELVDRIALKVLERRFKKLLDKTLYWYSINLKSSTESFILSEIIQESKDQDIFDLIDSLPEYFKNVGMNTEKIKGFSNYCLNRVKEVKEHGSKRIYSE